MENFYKISERKEPSNVLNIWVPRNNKFNALLLKSSRITLFIDFSVKIFPLCYVLSFIY